jgi:hypothetical protein
MFSEARQMCFGIAYPTGFRVELEQMLSDNEAEQFRIREDRFASRASGAGQAQTREHQIIEEDIKYGQEGVELVVHTKGLTPSAKL